MPIDNNYCEQQIKNFVTGRKAWGFCDSKVGATASANLYSLVMTARANGVEPFAYLSYVFEQLPTGELAIPTADFATGGGCIEKITTGPTPASGGCIVQNTALGSFANRIDFQTIDGSTIMWIAVNVSFGVGNIQRYDLTANMLGAAPITRADEDPIDLAVCSDGSLVISDGAQGASGLRVYNDGHEVSGGAIAIGLDTGNANALLCD